MSVLAVSIWALVMLLGFIGSALYSGMETGAYKLNRVRLQIHLHRRVQSAQTLGRLLDDPTVLLSTLLIGNNIANYMGTAGLSVIMDGFGIDPWQAVVLNTLIITPILFVFGETLPKDLFATYADRLMYRLAGVLNASRQVFRWTGLEPLILAVTRGLMRLMGQGGRSSPFHPRRQVQFLVREGVGYGLLSDEQSAILERVMGLAARRVGDEMVPWEQVIKVHVDDRPQALWELAQRTSRSRFPVIDGQGEVVGELNLMEALRHGREACPPIAELMREPVTLPASLPLRRGLSEVRRGHVALAVVVDPRRRPLGIVTTKDLVEAVTGELASW